MNDTMADGRAEIRWAPRVQKWKLRRLYASDAQGRLEEGLLEEIATTSHMHLTQRIHP